MPFLPYDNESRFVEYHYHDNLVLSGLQDAQVNWFSPVDVVAAQSGNLYMKGQSHPVGGELVRLGLAIELIMTTADNRKQVIVRNPETLIFWIKRLGRVRLLTLEDEHDALLKGHIPFLRNNTLPPLDQNKINNENQR